MDLSAVTVPEDLMELIHMLAENNHKVWAKERIKDGWKYGSATVSHYMKHYDIYYFSSKSSAKFISISPLKKGIVYCEALICVIAIHAYLYPVQCII